MFYLFWLPSLRMTDSRSIHISTNDPVRFLFYGWVVQLTSVTQSCPTLCDPWTAADQTSLPVTNSQSLLKLTSIELVMLSNHLIPCRPLLLLPSNIPSIRVFSNESALRIRCQSIGASASTSVLPMNTQDWSPLGWTGWIFLQSKGLSRVFSNTTVQKHQFFGTQPSLKKGSTLTSIHDDWKNHTFDLMDLCWQSNVCFLILSRLVIAFLPRNKHLLISWLRSPLTVILEPKKIRYVTVSIVSPSICHEVMGPDAMIFVFWMLSFKPTFSLFSFTFNKRPFSSSSLSAIRVVSSAYLRLLIFLPAIFIPTSISFSPAFHLRYSACKLNKQGDNIQPQHTPFPIWKQYVVPCPVLTVAS